VFPAGPLDEQAIRLRPDVARGALMETRHCREWCEYNPGHDPKGHLMERRLCMLEKRQNTPAVVAIVAAIAFGGAQVLASIVTAGPDSWIRVLFAKPRPPQGPISE